MVAVIGGAIHFNSRWTVQGHFASQWTVNAHNFPRSLPLTKFDDRWTHRKGSCISITPLPGTTPHPLPPPPPPPQWFPAFTAFEMPIKRGIQDYCFVFHERSYPKSEDSATFIIEDQSHLLYKQVRNIARTKSSLTAFTFQSIPSVFLIFSTKKKTTILV